MPHGSLRRAFPAAELISLRWLRRGDRIQCRARTEPDRDLTVGRVDHVAERSVTLARWIFFFADCLLGTKDQLHTPWTLDFHTDAALLEEAVRKTRSSGISSSTKTNQTECGRTVPAPLRENRAWTPEQHCAPMWFVWPCAQAQGWGGKRKREVGLCYLDRGGVTQTPCSWTPEVSGISRIWCKPTVAWPLKRRPSTLT